MLDKKVSLARNKIKEKLIQNQIKRKELKKAAFVDKVKYYEKLLVKLEPESQAFSGTQALIDAYKAKILEYEI